uniref:Uncharacterized protein n=1 Tax=Arundo donax TaxID=35708 RepID=A0A0A9F5W2_ARUDO
MKRVTATTTGPLRSERKERAEEMAISAPIGECEDELRGGGMREWRRERARRRRPPLPEKGAAVRAVGTARCRSGVGDFRGTPRSSHPPPILLFIVQQ